MTAKNQFTGHRRILAEFIELYRSEPCLWMTKCPEYRDRNHKDIAYERLVVKLKELDSTTDRDKVVRKINSLRTNWRKEKKKIEEADPINPYKPRLWYYHLFDFLEDYYPQDSVKYDEYEPIEEPEEDDFLDTLDYEELPSEDPVEHQGYLEEYQPPKSIRVLPKKDVNSIAVSSPQPTAIKAATLPTQIAGKLEKRTARSSDDEDHRQSSYDNFAVQAKRIKLQEDRHETFGRNVAMKLRHITDKTQRLLAEKLINDALFMAEMGELSMAHGVTSFNTRTQSPFEAEYISAPIEQYEQVSQQPVQEEVQTVNKIAPTGRRMQDLQEISRSILRRI